ncbi:MAG: hypothetical protein ABW073_03435, partial [Acidimicrobiia bacterium]
MDRRPTRAGAHRRGHDVIDLTLLRDNAEYRNAITRKRVREGLIDETLAADAERRQLDATVEALRARQNAASKE